MVSSKRPPHSTAPERCVLGRIPARLLGCSLTPSLLDILALLLAGVQRFFKTKQFQFQCQGFEKTILSANQDDILYCDPPYIDRHADYYNRWNEENETRLFKLLSKSPAKFILSTWHHNDFRKNKYIETLWREYNISTREHFYHVGGALKNRNHMVEALVTNYAIPVIEHPARNDCQAEMAFTRRTTESLFVENPVCGN